MSKPGRNDPCSCGSGKKYKHCCLLNEQHALVSDPAKSLILPRSSSPVAPPDPWRADADWGDDDEESPLSEAWWTLDQIKDDDDAKQQIKIAKNALKISQDCVGAYYYIGINEPDPIKALIAFDQGLAAADRVLAPRTLDELAAGDWFEEEVDWGMSTLRAKANSLLKSGQFEAGIATLHRLQRIDPLDRMAASGALMMLYLGTGQFEEAKQAEATMTSASHPTYAYGAALLKFILQGDTLFSRRSLVRALIIDPKIAFALDPTITLPGNVTDEDIQEQFMTEFADPSQALPLYGLAALWKNQEGALEWLHRVWEAGPRGRFAIELDPGGELLAVTPYESWDFRKCPICHRPTKPASRTLVTLVEPDSHVIHRVSGRFCPNDRVMIITNEELLTTVENNLPLDNDRHDYMPLGSIDPAELDARPPAQPRESWAVDHRAKFRGIDSYLERETTWFEPISEEEVDHLLRGLRLPTIPDELLRGIVG